LSERAIGAFYNGRNKVLPPAVGAVEEILRGVNSDPNFLSSQSVAIVGLGLLIGRPVANWIMRRAKETFLLRSTSNHALLAHADIVIAGVGKAGLITPEMLNPAGACVVDFGYDGGKGDFAAAGANTDAAKSENISYTPTPGGTGPVLVAKLFENFYKLNAGE
jgi:methylenetetrahydrofolate dehydrogenase (NADP+)/methenyltetrahydrofolate cyclohydrolase